MATTLSDQMELELTRFLYQSKRPLSSIDGRTLRALRKRKLLDVSKRRRQVNLTPRGKAFGLALRSSNG